MLDQIMIPLGPALAAAGTFLCSIICVLVWVFANFERKEEAIARHKSLETRVMNQEEVLQEVARDVSYIRGTFDKYRSKLGGLLERK